MWTLCRDLAAFYAKVGQLVAMQAYVPDVIRSQLARLQDDMPPMGKEAAYRIIAEELRKAGAGEVNDVFESIDLDNVLGCASIAQVHRGIVRENHAPVAIKVQHPHARRLMISDLGNFRVLAEILQRTELKFDLVGPVKELSEQLSAEFDFRTEASSMNTIRDMLRRTRVRGVRVPRARYPLVTERLLVMDYLEGTPLSKLGKHVRDQRAMAHASRKVLRHMSSAYGEMILTHGFFQADSHPGNIIVLDRDLNIGIIDYGQTKRLSNKRRLAFAKLVIAMSQRHARSVADGMNSLGIMIESTPRETRRGKKRASRRVKSSARSGSNKEFEYRSQQGGETSTQEQLTSGPNQPVQTLTRVERSEVPSSETTTGSETIPLLTPAEKLAYTMFDTAEVAGVSSNPFADDSALKTATVSELPKELFFLLRTTQILRGICAATGNNDFSIASAWAPIARRALRNAA